MFPSVVLCTGDCSALLYRNMWEVLWGFLLQHKVSFIVIVMVWNHRPCKHKVSMVWTIDHGFLHHMSQGFFWFRIVGIARNRRKVLARLESLGGSGVLWSPHLNRNLVKGLNVGLGLRRKVRTYGPGGSQFVCSSFWTWDGRDIGSCIWFSWQDRVGSWKNYTQLLDLMIENLSDGEERQRNSGRRDLTNAWDRDSIKTICQHCGHVKLYARQWHFPTVSMTSTEGISITGKPLQKPSLEVVDPWS